MNPTYEAIAQLSLLQVGATMDHESLHARKSESSALARLIDDHSDTLLFYPASRSWHQPWAGGLADHIMQIYAFMVVNRESYRCGHVSQLELLTIAVLHDWEKNWKYQVVKDFKSGSAFESAKGSSDGPTWSVDLPMRIGAALGRVLDKPSEELLNAISMSEGGWSTLARREKGAEMSPLATLLHAADMHSSKITKGLRGAHWKMWTEPDENQSWPVYVDGQPLAILRDHELKIVNTNLKEKAQWPV